MNKKYSKFIFGIDFDNTIVNYDDEFKNLFKKKYFFNSKNLNTKRNIKNYIIKKKGITEWKKFQSEIYSNHIKKAYPNIEILKLLKFLDKNKIKFYIVSHKTIYPYTGAKIDLHKISKKWIKNNIFNKENNFRNKYKYFFETTEKKK